MQQLAVVAAEICFGPAAV